MTENVSKLPVKKEDQARMTAGWTPLTHLRREIDRLFEDFHPFALGRAFRDMDWLPREWPVAPAVDLAEKEGGFEITAELPGLDQKDIEVKVTDGVITIAGEKAEERRDEKKDYHLSERRYGSFQRSFRLPDGVDAERIEAAFNNGLLTIMLPKSPTAAKNEKKIEIKAA
jgi:HSP20 family protein